MARKLNRRDHIDDIFEHMQKMFNNIQDLGSDAASNLVTNMAVDVHEDNGKVIVTADMPGVQKEDIDIKADNKGIEIFAESKEEIQEENEKYFRRERSSRSYRRTVSWPTSIDEESIKAHYQDGVLRVEAEKEDSEDKWNVEVK